MATKNNKGITYNYNKDGKIISYRITISNGYDEKGRQKRQTETYKVPEEMSKKKIETEALERKAALERQYKYYGSGISNMRFKDFMPTYFETKSIELSPTTYDFYKKAIETLIVPAFGNMKFREITPKHVQDFVNKLAKMPKRTRGRISENGECISAATVKRYMTVLQSIFKLAIKQGIITENPASREHLALPKEKTSKIDVLSKQEAASLLEALQEESLSLKVLVYLAIFSGMRRGELVALKFSDIDFDNRKINVERAAYKVSGSEQSTKPPKDYQARAVSINKACCELLKQLQKEKAAEKQRLGNLWIDGDWVFTKWNGEMMNKDTPTRQFNNFLKRHNLKHIKLHALRHTHATLLLYAGVDIKEVQTRLGHGDIETTNKYLHMLEEADVEAVDLLDNMLLTKTEDTERKIKIS